MVFPGCCKLGVGCPPLCVSCLCHSAGLPQLTTLASGHWPVADRPEMVAGLADRCPQLQELSLKDSEKVTDREVPEIRRCLRLTSLDISGTSVTGGLTGSLGRLGRRGNVSWSLKCLNIYRALNSRSTV